MFLIACVQTPPPLQFLLRGGGVSVHRLCSLVNVFKFDQISVDSIAYLHSFLSCQ